MAYKKYEGIDLRKIKCCDTADNTIEAGISFDFDEQTGHDILRFHFLEYLDLKNGKQILQVTEKQMHLNNENIKQLIAELKELRNFY